MNSKITFSLTMPKLKLQIINYFYLYKMQERLTNKITKYCLR